MDTDNDVSYTETVATEEQFSSADGRRASALGEEEEKIYVDHIATMNTQRPVRNTEQKNREAAAA